jgi:hypothetical protein
MTSLPFGVPLVSRPVSASTAARPTPPRQPVMNTAVAKEAHMVDMLSTALRARGAGDEPAAIAARTGWGILAHAMSRWRADPAISLGEHVERAFRQLRTLTAASPAARSAQ